MTESLHTPDYAPLARVIWETSRRDEGTISATGANHVARAVIGAILSPRNVNAAARELYEQSGGGMWEQEMEPVQNLYRLRIEQALRVAVSPTEPRTGDAVQ